MNRSIYTVGGTVQAGHGLYLQRQADEELFSQCQAGAYTYILSARQMGKSSLMVRTANRLGDAGVRSVIVDLTELGVLSSREEWYLGLLTRIHSRAGLDVDLMRWWAENAHLGVSQSLVAFFQQVLLTEIREPIVIFVDEIDSTLSLDFTDDFFAAIRYLYNARAVEPELQRLTFVLIGVATPSDLIEDAQRTPFNVGQRIELGDFSEAELAPLAEGLPHSLYESSQVMVWIRDWTTGHPYLTQRLCAAIAEKNSTISSQADVDTMVNDLFLGKMSDHDSNLLFVSDMLTRRAPDPLSVLRMYEAVRLGKRPVRDQEQSASHSHLKLSGIVRRDGEYLRVRNRIYEEVFDHDWIRSQEPVNWWTLLPREVKIATGVIAVMFIALILTLFYAVRQQQQVQTTNSALELANQDLVTEVALRGTAEAEARQSAGVAATREAEAVAAQDQAEQERARAEQQAEIATSRLLATQSRSLAQEAPDLALLLAVESQRIADTLSSHVDTGSTAALSQVLETNQHLAQILHGHTDRVRSVAVNPAGSLAASASHDKTIHLWDLSRQEPRGEPLTDHAAEIEAISFSPDGAILASAGQDGAILLWDVEVGQPLLPPLEGHTDRVWSVAFSSDGAQLVSGSKDGTIRLWDTATGESLGEPFEAHKNGVRSVIFGQEDRILVSGGDDRRVRIWDTETRQPLDQTLNIHQDTVTDLALQPDGAQFASSSYDGTVLFWNTEDGEMVEKPLRGHTDQVWSIAYAKNGERLVSGSKDGSVILWDLASGQPLLAPLHGHQGSVRGVALTQNGNLIVSGGDDGKVFVWTVEPPERNLIQLEGHSEEVRSIALSPDGATMASGDESGLILLWHSTGDSFASRPLGGHRGRIWSLAFSPTGGILASVGKDKTVQLWDAESATALSAPLEGHEEEVTSVVFHPHSNILATGDKAGTVLLWGLDTGQPIHPPLMGHSDRIWSLAFSADGDQLVSASKDGTIRLWETATGSPLSSPLGNSERNAESATIHAGTMRAALGHNNGGATLWDLVSGTADENAIGANGSLESIALSADGNLLAGGTKEGMIMVWDLVSGQLVNSIPDGHAGAVRSLTFTLDGAELISAGADHLIKLWPLGIESEIARACVIANRNLTKEEWEQHVGSDVPFRNTCQEE